MVMKRKLGYAFLALSVVPLGFLVYSLLNLQALQITIAHPRVIVEASCFVALIIMGAVFSSKGINRC
jgi:hypothetical protein